MALRPPPASYTRPDPKTLVALGALAQRPAESPGDGRAEPDAAAPPPHQPAPPEADPPRVRRQRRRRPAVSPRLASGALIIALVIASAGAAAVTLRDGGGSSSGEDRNASSRGRLAAAHDYDGNRRRELAVGLPSWRLRGSPAAGAVMIVPALRGRSPLVLDQRGPKVPGDPQRFAQFGWALASADFDRDGFADLAVGAPGYDAGTAAGREGAVVVLRGAKGGLRRAEGRLLPGPESRGGANSRYGEALSTGDLDGDGFPDLVVGAPGYGAREGARGSGAISVLFGGTDGLAPKRARRLDRARGRDAAFGSLVAVGDVDRDGHQDVVEAAAGVPVGLRSATLPGHGSFCPGRRDGPAGCRRMGGGPAGGPTALAVGEVTGDRFPDVVHGVAVNRYVDALADVPAGAVVVWRGTRRGPHRRPLRITQESPGLVGNDQPADRFGAAIALGDVNGDGHTDMVIGAAAEDAAAGRVTVVPGSGSGLRASRARAYSQDQRGVPGGKTAGNAFGSDLALLDLNADRRAELAVAAPGDFRSASALIVLPGGRDGPRSAGARRLRALRTGRRSPGTTTVVALAR